MKTASIGFLREDGDFAVLATLNNNDDHISDNDFHALVRTVHIALLKSNPHVIVLERQDTPDYVEIN